MNQESNLCDISYDSDLKRIEGVVRLPWVGREYQQQEIKTLILGESVYDWNPKDPLNKDRINSAHNLRNLHKSHAMDFKRKSKFVRNIEKAIYGKRKPTDSEKEFFWNSVCYHNLVNRVLKTKKHRPSYNDYYSGWSTFEQLVDLLQFDQVVVYGLEQKKIKSLIKYCDENSLTIEHKNLPEKVGRSYPKKITITKGSRKIKLLFIRHPSSYFSWKKWSPIIKSEIIYPAMVA